MQSQIKKLNVSCQTLQAETKKLLTTHEQEKSKVQSLQEQIGDLSKKLARANDLPYKIKDEEYNLEQLSSVDESSMIPNFKV